MVQDQTMNDDYIQVTVQIFKENPTVYDGEEPYSMLWWGKNVDPDDHPFWVIDYLEAGGWKKHLPEPEYDETITGITVEYNPNRKHDIRLVILPDGTEITADQR